MKPDWSTKMILVLLAWCLFLAIGNWFQSYQIERLTRYLEEMQDAILEHRP